MDKKTKILKFGGTSIKTPERVEQVIRLILSEPPTGVVVSAIGGVTDLLIKLTQMAASGKKYSNELKSFMNFHIQFLHGLNIQQNLKKGAEAIQNIEKELTKNLNTIVSAQSISPKLNDAVLSVGERMSANIIATACLENGLDVEYLDARNVILTDNHFGSAFVHYQTSYDRIRTVWDKKSTTRIITGFIGSTENGETTTFGRSGSDYTASIFGAALNVNEIEI